MKNKHHFFLLKGSGELGDYGLNFIFLEVFIFNNLELLLLSLVFLIDCFKKSSSKNVTRSGSELLFYFD